MRAMLCRTLAGPEALELAELPVPEPGACHVRVRVRAAGVNFADKLMLEGRYQERPPLPFVPGLEVSGVIEAVGAAVPALEKGQRVLALLDHGGFAETALAREDDVIPLPPFMDDVTAAGFAVVYGTAHGALRWRADLHAGDALLVLGASGGAGLAAVEVGKALGATVIAAARGEAGLALARQQGADHLIDSAAPDLKARVMALTGGRGADVVFDPVGGPLTETGLRCLAWEGRLLLIGFAAGAVAQIPANLLLVKNVAALGFYWGSYRRHDPDRLRQSLRDLFRLYAEGKIRPHVAERVPLAGAAEAIRLLGARRAAGKVVVTIAD